MDRLRVRIEGRVQGVGFRYATYRQAQDLGLTGWVRNCGDGGVEALFEGSKDDLERMLAWCRHGPAYADVRQIETTWESGEPRCTGFSVRG